VISVLLQPLLAQHIYKHRYRMGVEFNRSFYIDNDQGKKLVINKNNSKVDEYPYLGVGVSFVVGVDYTDTLDQYGFGFSMHQFCGSPVTISEFIGDQNDIIRTTVSGHYTGACLDYIIRTNYTGKLNIETRFGPMIVPYSGQKEVMINTKNNFESRKDIVHNMDLGIKADIGASIKLKKHIKIDFFIGTSLFASKTKHGKYTTYRFGGINMLETMPTSAKKFNYKKEISQASNTPNNPNFDPQKPSDLRKYTRSYNSLRLGFRLTF